MADETDCRLLADPVERDRQGKFLYLLPQFRSWQEHLLGKNNVRLRGMLDATYFRPALRWEKGQKGIRNRLAYNKGLAGELMTAHALFLLDEPDVCRANVLCKKEQGKWYLAHAPPGKPDVYAEYSRARVLIEVSFKTDFNAIHYSAQVQSALEHLDGMESGGSVYALLLNRWHLSTTPSEPDVAAILEAHKLLIQKQAAQERFLIPINFDQWHAIFDSVHTRGRLTQADFKKKLATLAKAMLQATENYTRFSDTAPDLLEVWESSQSNPEAKEKPSSSPSP